MVLTETIASCLLFFLQRKLKDEKHSKLRFFSA